jgi:flagellar biosynthesis protein FlhA
VRTAEVTARFTLDALPGKQMAIDADMNAGLIDEAGGAQAPPGDCPRGGVLWSDGRRGALQSARFAGHDSDYRHQHHRRPADRHAAARRRTGEAARTYTVLTVGDGLVTLIPSLLVSVAGGITLTRANSAGMLGGEIRQQLLGAGHALSGQPGLGGHVPDSGTAQAGLSAGGRGAVWCARRVSAHPGSCGAAGGVRAGREEEGRQAQSSDLANLLRLEDLTLEIGFQLIPLVDEKQGGQLLNRVRSLRRHLSAEMGFLVPPVHISDNLRLKPARVPIQLAGDGDWPLADRGAAVAGRLRRPQGGVLWPARRRGSRPSGCRLSGLRRRLEDQAIAAGYSVVDAVTVITTHLGELIRQHGYELLGRSETKRLMDALNESHPKLWKNWCPSC